MEKFPVDAPKNKVIKCTQSGIARDDFLKAYREI